MPPRKKAKKAKKTTAKKTVKKTAVKRKAAAPKKKAAAPKKKVASTTAIKSSMNKSQIMTHMADSTGLSKKDVAAVFDSLSNLMHRHLKKNAAGEFTVPGLMKCVVKRKPATKARKGINPFTSEPMTFKAKPARNVVKVRPLKRVKEMAE